MVDGVKLKLVCLFVYNFIQMSLFINFTHHELVSTPAGQLQLQLRPASHPLPLSPQD